MTTKQPPPEGMGDEVILFEPQNLRDIAKLPPDIEIVGIVGPPPDKHHDWVPNHFIYVHVRHKLAVRCPPRQTMSWTTIDEFCQRIESLREQYELP